MALKWCVAQCPDARRIFTLPVKQRPGWKYRFSLYSAFRSEQGIALEPRLRSPSRHALSDDLVAIEAIFEGIWPGSPASVFFADLAGDGVAANDDLKDAAGENACDLPQALVGGHVSGFGGIVAQVYRHAPSSGGVGHMTFRGQSMCPRFASGVEAVRRRPLLDSYAAKDAGSAPLRPRPGRADVLRDGISYAIGSSLRRGQRYDGLYEHGDCPLPHWGVQVRPLANGASTSPAGDSLDRRTRRYRAPMPRFTMLPQTIEDRSAQHDNGSEV